MLEIKRSRPTLKLNYIMIPVTRTDSVEKFNKVFFEYRDREYNKANRTKSGGISVKHLRLPIFDLTVNKWGCELLVCDKDGNFRLQFRNKIFDDPNIDEVEKKITGTQAINKFYQELKQIGIDLNDYAINNGKEVKATIEKPMISLKRQSFKDITFEGCNHVDINSSYPAGVKEYHPEFAPVIDKWYKLKKEGHKEYKAYLNLMIGTMQSQYQGYRYADISAYAIKRNNDKIKEMAKWLEDNGRMVLSYNTDGIWFQGESIPKEMQSSELGKFKQDHTNCKFRAKSDGAYEFIEDGKYYPVIRGKTRLDELLPRDKWKWGDIYQENAYLIKKFRVTMEKGVEEIYEELE